MSKQSNSSSQGPYRHFSNPGISAMYVLLIFFIPSLIALSVSVSGLIFTLFFPELNGKFGKGDSVPYDEVSNTLSSLSMWSSALLVVSVMSIILLALSLRVENSSTSIKYSYSRNAYFVVTFAYSVITIVYYLGKLIFKFLSPSESFLVDLVEFVIAALVITPIMIIGTHLFRRKSSSYNHAEH